MKILKNLFISLTLVCSFSLSAETIKNFELPIFGQSKIFKMQEQRGKTVVINFFASWCLACLQEIGELNALKEKYNRAGHEFVAINAGDTPVQIKKLLKKHPFDFLILEDSTKQISKSLGVNELPRTMVISPAGEILFNSSKPPKNLN